MVKCHPPNYPLHIYGTIICNLIESGIEGRADRKKEKGQKQNTIEIKVKAEKILVVDDEPAIRELIKSLLELTYDVDTAVDGLDALEKIGRNEYEAIISDIKMPNLDGIGLLRRLREIDEDMSVIMVTAVEDIDVIRKTIKSSIYDYITKPFLGQIIDVTDKAVERTKLLRQVRNHQEYLEKEVVRQRKLILGATFRSISSLCNALDARDSYTAGHSARVADCSRRIAEEMQSSEAEPQQINDAGLLHDVGKIGIPDAILLKNGKLSPDEYEKVKEHPLEAVRILAPAIMERQTLAGIRHHHERYDGNGYPDGLAGQSIPLAGRILACADCYDALTSTRSYRDAMTEGEAIKEIKRVTGTQLDPDVVDVFLRLINIRSANQIGEFGPQEIKGG